MAFTYSDVDWLTIKEEYVKGGKSIESYSKEYNNNSQEFPSLNDLWKKADRDQWHLEKDKYKLSKSEDKELSPGESNAVKNELRKISNIKNKLNHAYQVLRFADDYQSMIIELLPKVQNLLKDAPTDDMNFGDAVTAISKLAIVFKRLAEMQQYTYASVQDVESGSTLDGVSITELRSVLDEMGDQQLLEALEEYM